MSKCVVSLVTRFSPHGQCQLDVLRMKEQVKIFGVTIDPRVFSERVGASDQKVDFIIAKQLHYRPANLASALRFHSIKCALQTACASIEPRYFRKRRSLNGRKKPNAHRC